MAILDLPGELGKSLSEDLLKPAKSTRGPLIVVSDSVSETLLLELLSIAMSLSL